MRIHLRGYYGHLNTGDDALVYSTVAGLERIAPGNTYRIASTRQLCLPVGLDRVKFLPARQHFRGHLRIAGLLQAVDCKWTIFGGGSLINDVGGSGYLARTKLLVRFLKRIGRRVAMIGMGVGPLDSNCARMIARKMLADLDLLTVRDEISADLCQRIGMQRPEVVGDLALAMPAPSNHARFTSTTGLSTLGVAVCNYHQYIGEGAGADERRLEKIIVTLKKLVGKQACHLVIFEFNGHPARGDKAVAERIMDELESLTSVTLLPYTPDPSQVLADIGACDAVLTMRLHASVFAYLGVRPMVMLSYHMKCLGFAREVGLDDNLVLDSEEFSSETLCERLLHCLKSPQSVLASVSAKEMSDRAMRSFTLLRHKLDA